MRVLYLTNIPSPYRVNFFNELGKLCELTVLFEARYSKERDKNWTSDIARNYKATFMKGIRCGVAEAICPEVIKYLSPNKYDLIVVGMYSSPTGMLAIEYMRNRKIKFILNTDGGIIKKDTPVVHKFKQHFVGSASAWLSTGEMATDYLCHYGAKREKVYKYPFTSVAHDDIVSANSFSKSDKSLIRNMLGIPEEKKMVISVGQFIYRKGFDILLEACRELDNNIEIYIIGGEPTEEYLNLKEKFELSNVHFVGFMTKDKLADYYKAADVFVLPTREDVWGLVVNEAMAYGLPVVTTDMCGAGLEMIKTGENGVIVPVNDPKKLALAINKAFEIDTNKVMTVAREYTIETMAKVHKQCFDNYLSRSV